MALNLGLSCVLVLSKPLAMKCRCLLIIKIKLINVTINSSCHFPDIIYQYLAQSSKVYLFTAISILDLFFTNRPCLVEKLEIQPGINDHDITYIQSALRPAKIKPVKRKTYSVEEGGHRQFESFYHDDGGSILQ